MAATKGSGQNLGVGGAGQMNWPPLFGAASVIGGYAASFTSSVRANWCR